MTTSCLASSVSLSRQSRPSVSAAPGFYRARRKKLAWQNPIRRCAFRHPHFGPFLRMERRFSPSHPQFAPFLRMGQPRLRHARLTTFRRPSCPAPTAFRLPSCPALTGHPVVVRLRSSGVLPRSQKNSRLAKPHPLLRHSLSSSEAIVAAMYTLEDQTVTKSDPPAFEGDHIV